MCVCGGVVMWQSLEMVNIPGSLFFRAAVLQRKPECSSGEARQDLFGSFCRVWSPARVQNRTGSYEDAEMDSCTGI